MFNFKILKIKYHPPDVLNIGYEKIFSKINRITILNTLMQNFDNFLFIVDIDWIKEPDNEFIKGFMFIEDSFEFLVSKKKSLCLVSGKLPKEHSDILHQLTRNFNCFLEFPITLEKSVIKGNIVGTHQDVFRFLDFIKNWGADFEVFSVNKYHPRGYGVLSALTLQQSKCLKVAVESGFFDFPKKNNSRAIAKKLGISHPTFIEHIKKAEKTIFSNLFKM